MHKCNAYIKVKKTSTQAHKIKENDISLSLAHPYQVLRIKNGF